MLPPMVRRAASTLGVAGLVALACQSGGEARREPASGSAVAPAPTPPPGSVKPLSAAFINVDAAAPAVAAPAAPAPAAIVTITATGALAVGRTPAKWSGELPSETRAAEVDSVWRHVLVAAIEGDGPARADAERELDRLDDDGAESGGTGTLINLEEKPPEVRARERELEDARHEERFPGRRSRDEGRAQVAAPVPLPRLRAPAPLVLAAAAAPAPVLARVLREAGGMLGVWRDGALAVLDLAYTPFARDELGNTRWIEVSPDAAGLHVVARPGGIAEVVPWKAGEVDRAGVAAVLARLGPAPDGLDVLAGDDTSAQRLVDVLVAVRLAGREAAVGVRTGTIAEHTAALRQQLARTLRFGQASVNGPLDKPLVRERVIAQRAALEACDARARARKPDLAGTVVVMFLVGPTGAVRDLRTNGADPELAACVAKVVKALTFPKPTHGGSAQVTYPFAFRPPIVVPDPAAQ